MLRKNPKRQYLRYVRGGVKVLFAVEAVLFVASYGVWHRLNTSRGKWANTGKRFFVRISYSEYQKRRFLTSHDGYVMLPYEHCRGVCTVLLPKLPCLLQIFVYICTTTIPGFWMVSRLYVVQYTVCINNLFLSLLERSCKNILFRLLGMVSGR
jgi:hypothetical protein